MDLEALRQALAKEPAFEVAGPPVDAAGLALGDGPMAVTARSGRLWPVAARAGGFSAAVGWIFQGEADLTLTWPDRHDARRFANRQVLVLGTARDRVATMAAGGPWVTTVDRALLLGVEPEGAEKRPVIAGEDASVGSRVLDARLRQVTRVGRLARVAIDALLANDGALDGKDATGWLDVHTPDRYGAATDGAGTADDQGWVAYARDPRGTWGDDGDCGSIVTIAGELAAGADAQGLAALPCTAGPVATPARTETTVRVGDEADYALAVTGTSTLEIRAVQPVRSVLLDVSFLGSRGRLGPVTTPDGARVDMPAQAPPRDGGPPKTLYVVLPEPLAPGATTRLAFTFADAWTFGVPKVLGRGTRPLRPQPRLAGSSWWRPGPSLLRIGVPAQADIDVAINGSRRAWEADGLRWVEARDGKGEHRLQVALGRWETVREDALPSTDPVQKQPAIEVNLFPVDKDALRPTLGFARSVIYWMNQVLPPFPPDALTVFQSPDGWFGFTWIAPDGMVSLQKARAFDAAWYEDLPHHAESVFVHELAHQYWGNRVAPARDRDGWLSETLAEVYADLYAGAAWGDAALDARADRHREQCEELKPGINVGLDSPDWRTGALYECGPYLFERGLLDRVGYDTLLGALDGFARTHADAPVRGDELLAAIQAATPVALGDFFDTWVYDGWIPKLEATWWQSPAGLGGTVTADVPFGVYEVPVWVVHGSTGDLVWCRVVDGQGTWTLPFTGKIDRVELDPRGRILARLRSLRKVAASK